MQWSGGARVFENGMQHLFLMGSDEAKYALHLGVHDRTWTLDPDVDTMLNFGTANHRWNTGYISSGIVQTSDRNLKNSITPLTEKHMDFFHALLPVSFKFNDGDSGRTHIGFISQDVEKAMEKAGLSSLDFAGFCKDQKTERIFDGDKYMDVPVDGEYIYSLRYEEFIAINTMMIQKI